MVAVRRIRGSTFGIIVLFVAGACGSPTAPGPSVAAGSPQLTTVAVSTTAGDVIATEDLTPESDGVVQGTGPDGTRYELDVPAFALVKPTTLSMRPLGPVKIDGGDLVAGVELEPTGTTFAMPLILTITPVAGDAAKLVPFAYAGTPDAATASLALTDSIDAASLRLVVPHFSGMFVARPVGPDVVANWTKVGRQPDPGASTPEQQAAWATAAMAAAKYDIDATKASSDASSMDAQTRIDAAQGIYDHAQSVLAQASADQSKALMDEWTQDTSKVKQIAADGNIDDAAEFKLEIEKVAIPAAIAAHSGLVDGDSVIKKILDLTDTYLENIAKSLDADPAFQAGLAKGTPDVLSTLTEVASLVLGVERQVQLLGRPEGGTGILSDKMTGWLRQFAHTYGARCVDGLKTPPVDAIAYARQMAMLGDDSASGAMMDCAAASAPFYPPPRPKVTPQPAATDDQPVTDHVSVKGHSVTQGLPSSLGQSTDGQNVADLTAEMDIRFQSVGGVVQMTLVSGTYTLTGSETGDCAGSGTDSGPLTNVQNYRISNAGGSVQVGIDINGSASLSASFSYPITCATIQHDPKNNNNPYVVQEPGIASGSLFGFDCALTPGGGLTSCTGSNGTTWTVGLART